METIPLPAISLDMLNCMSLDEVNDLSLNYSQPEITFTIVALEVASDAEVCE